MPFYYDSTDFYNVVEIFFTQMRTKTPNPIDSLLKSRITIRIELTDIDASINLNARMKPVEITYGIQPKYRPELNVQLTSETLHNILLKNISLSQAVGTREMKVLGPVWKSFPLKDIFEQGQEVYPKILRDLRRY